jgi:hypothetical protein
MTLWDSVRALAYAIVGRERSSGLVERQGINRDPPQSTESNAVQARSEIPSDPALQEHLSALSGRQRTLADLLRQKGSRGRDAP